MSQTCPSCEAPASGRFCPQCGVAIDAQCRECQNPLPAGARFCNQCGLAVSAQPAAPARAKQPALPWAIAAVTVALLAATTILPRLTGDEATPVPLAQQQGAAPGGAGDPSQVDLASMTPRQAADRLFNRVMQGLSAGNNAEVQQFAPMAIQAYGMVPERDSDLHYHLGELYRVTGDAVSARAQADTILAADPQHLFGLYGAARAEELRGNAGAAQGLYQRFLDAYPTQVARNLPEYQEHSQGLPSMRAAAQQAVGG
ncbi:double zinc ribbon domain-containing protein [Longimicrobium sp.]|uniref:double zinc ribbon domain-containing protein n=1 Tax=Longimicrobium sp. TaxID=2029185 RepID=UPI003B3B1B3C